MKIDLSHFKTVFMEESAEHVSTIETGLLALRSAPDDTELLNAIFRSAHSIKGGAGSFGLTNLVRFTHVLESLLDRLRSMEMIATDHVINLLIQSVDILRDLLDADVDGPAPAAAASLVEQIEALSAPDSTSVEGAHAHVEAAVEPEAEAEVSRQYKVFFKPNRDLLSSGTNPLLMLRNLGALGTVDACELHCEELPPLIELDPSLCYLAWTITLTTSAPEAELREVFEFVEDAATITIDQVTASAPARSTVVEMAAPVAVVPVVEERRGGDRREGDRRVEERRGGARKPGSGAESSSIRVATDKVDRLIDLVGELVIAQVMTAQMVATFTPHCLPKLREAVSAMERNTRELHESIMSVRMLPVGTVFQRFTRTVYDIAQMTGKQIKLETGGEETEIDKSMLELLGDPLTHLIRNAADHGVESPEVRIAAGKVAEGTINLRAFHRSGKVVIEISDDGAGIDCARVRAKAIERGLISATAQMTDDQLRLLIFEPGFSTREEVSDLSGRGVGMDVVKRNVQQLNGTISLVSEKGLGSTVSIELPLTLAIMEGLLVRVADRTLVLPLLSVIETVSPKTGQLVRVAEQGEVVLLRGESIPLLRLSRFLGIASQASMDGIPVPDLVVVVEAGRRKIALAIDELLGQQQVVVKSLERHLRKIDGLMGATILGDGCVAPILDVIGIADMDLFSLQPSAAAPLHLVHSAPANDLLTLTR